MTSEAVNNPTDQDVRHIRELRDMLAEAVRYRTSSPRDAEWIAREVWVRLVELQDFLGVERMCRLTDNLGCACDALVVDPEVFAAYCLAVSWELLVAGGSHVVRQGL